MSHPDTAEIQPKHATLLLAQTLDFPDPHTVRHCPRAALIIEQGRILWHGNRSELPWSRDAFAQCHDYGDAWLLPGFIDAHVHAAQLPVMASWGTQLLDWLNQYTFPAERRFEQLAMADQENARFLDQLLAHGTTTAMVFSTVHEQATASLFAAAEQRNMAILAGKVLMDRHCPVYLQDTAQSGYDASARLIDQWHGRSRLRYAITPRFAPTSSEAQLEQAGALMARAQGLYLQTHIAENPDEIAWVKALFPWAKDYADVYHHYGLLHERSILAHGIHLQPGEWERLSDQKARLAVCPTSNTFLGSGLFDFRTAEARSVPIALASDVGGGTSLSMLVTAAEAYKVGQLGGHRLTASQLAYGITQGNARALSLEDEIGTLDVGKMADLVIYSPSAKPLLDYRMDCADTIEEQLFAMLMLGDEQCVTATWVAGQCLYKVNKTEQASFVPKE